MTHPSDGLLASDTEVLVVGARQAMADRDGSPREPLLRLRGTCLGGSFRLTQG